MWSFLLSRTPALGSLQKASYNPPTGFWSSCVWRTWDATLPVEFSVTHGRGGEKGVAGKQGNIWSPEAFSELQWVMEPEWGFAGNQNRRPSQVAMQKGDRDVMTQGKSGRWDHLNQCLPRPASKLHLLLEYCNYPGRFTFSDADTWISAGGCLLICTYELDTVLCPWLKSGHGQPDIQGGMCTPLNAGQRLQAGVEFGVPPDLSIWKVVGGSWKVICVFTNQGSKNQWLQPSAVSKRRQTGPSQQKAGKCKLR